MPKGKLIFAFTAAAIFLLNAALLATFYSNEYSAWWQGLKSTSLVILIAAFGCISSYFILQKKHPGTAYPDIKTVITLFVYSFLISLLCVDLETYPEQFLLVGIGTASIICLLHACLGRISIILWSSFLFIQAVQWVGYHQLGLKFSASIIGEILHASRTEISNILTPANCAALLGAFVASFLLSVTQYKVLKKNNRFSLILLGFSCLFIFESSLLVIPYQHRLKCGLNERASCLPYPIQETISLASAGYIGSQQDAKLLLTLEKLKSPAASPSLSKVGEDVSGMVCIVHIGESVMADHLHFNGYPKQTTPWLSRQNNLISFPRCVSLYHITTTAVAGMLTDGARIEAVAETFDLVAPQLGNVGDLFAKHGYYTAMLVGENAIQQKNAETRYTFGEAMKTLTSNMDALMEAPGDPLKQVEQLLDVCNAHKERNVFIILNNEGSHGPFRVYDHANPAFTPTNPEAFYGAHPESEIEEFTNAYDNTIAYTDDCIRRIAEGLKGRPFVYIYISDHGEFLGRNDKYGRGWVFSYPTPQEGTRLYRQQPESLVGMFILPSNDWISLHPHFAQATEQLRKNRQITICHGHLFDTLLGMFGIQTEHYQAQWDISSPDVKPYRGTQPAQ